MSKKVRLDSVDDRKSLKLRRSPYRHRLSKGRYVTYRRMSAKSPGQWGGAALEPVPTGEDQQRYVHKALGELADVKEEKDKFDKAVALLAPWFKHLDGGGTGETTTVRGACEAYVEFVKVDTKKRADAESRESAAKNAEAAFNRSVYNDPIATARLDLPTKRLQALIVAWRARVAKKAKTLSTEKRNLAPLRSALNHAYDVGAVTSDAAWRVALRSPSIDDVETPGRHDSASYLSPDQRQQLVDLVEPEFRDLLISWTLLPTRPGDIPSCRVSDFSERERTLRIRKGKTKARIIPLPPKAVAHFKECARNKLPTAWLVSKADGSKFVNADWQAPMKEAAAKAKLPPTTVAYCIRHSVIADLLAGGLDMMTVSKVSGTSLRMLDVHYGKMIDEVARAGLAKLSG